MKKILSLISVFILISGILTAQVKPTPKKQNAKPFEFGIL
jgi:hypothetical protein